MYFKLFVFAFLGVVLSADEGKNSKRSISGVRHPWNSVLEHSIHPGYHWHDNTINHGYLLPYSSAYPIKISHYSAAATAHDVAAAIAAAKEATAAAALAHQKVQAAKEQVLIQERVAAAKEAAAHAAIQRSKAAAHAAASIQRSEAIAAAAAAAHKSATSNVASAHYPTGPWIHSKNGFNHWG